MDFMNWKKTMKGGKNMKKKTGLIMILLMAASLITVPLALAQENDKVLEDLNNDGFVDRTDMKMMLNNWGPCENETRCYDVTDDKKVDVRDLLQLLGAWNPRPSPDLNNDGKIDKLDLDILIEAWGECNDTSCNADLNNDGEVGIRDLLILLRSWSDSQDPIPTYPNFRAELQEDRPYYRDARIFEQPLKPFLEISLTK